MLFVFRFITNNAKSFKLIDLSWLCTKTETFSYLRISATAWPAFLRSGSYHGQRCGSCRQHHGIRSIVDNHIVFVETVALLWPLHTVFWTIVNNSRCKSCTSREVEIAKMFMPLQEVVNSPFAPEMMILFVSDPIRKWEFQLMVDVLTNCPTNKCFNAAIDIQGR